MKLDVTASIVLFENNIDILKQAIDSFLNTRLKIKLFLIDNSPHDTLRSVVADARCVYIFNNRNMGFAAGHNVALRQVIDSSKYHLILNPDVYFNAGVIEELIQLMEGYPDVGQVMPKILYPSGQIQYSGKLLPDPLDLIGRRLFPNLAFFQEKNKNYELLHSGYDRTMNVPHHLGCFMLVRTDVLRKTGLFDERMFMYMEDIDFTRRIHMYYRTLYYPQVSVYHHYAQGSRRKLKLLLYHLRSAVIYFNKWGWFFDIERKRINAQVLSSYNKASTM